MKQARGRHRLPHAYSFRNSSRSFAMLGAIRLSYFLGCLLRTKERYIRAKAASNTPPNIKIKVVTICSPFFISKKSLVGVQRLICSPKTRRGSRRQTSPHRPNYCGGWRSNKKRVERRGLAARELCCSLATSLTGYMRMPSGSCKTARKDENAGGAGCTDCSAAKKSDELAASQACPRTETHTVAL
jgi:hypothetical protein